MSYEKLQRTHKSMDIYSSASIVEKYLNMQHLITRGILSLLFTCFPKLKRIAISFIVVILLFS